MRRKLVSGSGQSTTVQCTPAQSSAVFAPANSRGTVPANTPDCSRSLPSLSAWLATTAPLAGSKKSVGP